MADQTPDGRLRVSRSCSIGEHELRWKFSGSGGPGGQHANTANTRVELFFDVAASESLGPRQRSQLLERLGPLVRVVVAETRSQHRNRELAMARLADRLRAALARDPPRRPTRPSAASKRKRLDSKRRRSEAKNLRRRPDPE